MWNKKSGKVASSGEMLQSGVALDLKGTSFLDLSSASPCQQARHATGMLRCKAWRYSRSWLGKAKLKADSENGDEDWTRVKRGSNRGA